MLRVMLVAALLWSSTAFADWKDERKWFAAAGEGFTKTYGGKTAFVVLETDLSGKPVDPDEVARRPGSVMIGVTCGSVLDAFRQLALKNGEPDDYFLKAFGGVQTVTCQYAHYFKGRDKDLDVGDRVLQAGNPDDKNEPPEDCTITFDPDKGDTIKAIHIVMNRHLYDPRWRGVVVDTALKKRFAHYR